MNVKQYGNRRHSRLMITLGSVLILLCSVALFVVMQSGAPSIAIAAVRGQFYTPVTTPSDSLAGRFLFAFTLLRFAMWPIAAFVGLWAGAAYAIFRLLPSGGRFSAIRRWATGAGLSLVVSIALAALWTVAAGRSSQ